MVKITPDLISRSAQFLNPVKEFQLDLRGYKIAAIENLSATNDQFGCIDLSDNSITKIEELPKLNRLRTLILINNRIMKIEKDFALNCANIENMILTNNRISSISEIDNLSSCRNLIRLSLVDNLVTKMKYYRLYTIYRLPKIRVLDFQKVKLKERTFAKALFESEKGKKLIEEMINKQFHEEDESEYVKAVELINKDITKQKMIYNIIQNADNIEDIRKFERSVLAGNLEKELKMQDENEEDVYK